MSTGTTAKATAKYHGLINLGSTCYLNSVLQVLFMTKEFRDAVIRFVEENPDTDFIDRHLKHLFTELQKRKTKTRRIIKALSIHKVHDQQDAAEYLEKILRLTSPDAAEIFHGQMAHRTTCSVCGTQNDRDGRFWHLPLELVDSSSGNYSVRGGIETFFRASEFSGENQMYCDTCGDKVDATSRYVITLYPDVLILLLKRFDFDHHHMSVSKINSCVDIPHILMIPENQTYKLYAAVEHVDDLRSGHYIATIKSQDDERWYIFNDTEVTPLEYSLFPDNMNISRSDDAYLLFYRKEAADTGTEEPMEACTYEDQFATGGMHEQKNENTANFRSVPDVTPVDGRRSAVPATCGRPETETAESQAQHCGDFKQNGGDNGVEKDRLNTDVKAKKKRGESDKADYQEDDVTTDEIKEKSDNDQKLSRRNRSRSKNREKDRSNSKSDEIYDVDQRKLDDQKRRKTMTRSHLDQSVVDQERRPSQQEIIDTPKTLKKASTRSNRKQKSGEDVADSQRRSGSETTGRLRENDQPRTSRRSQGAADRKHSSKHSQVGKRIDEEPREVPSGDKGISRRRDIQKSFEDTSYVIDHRKVENGNLYRELEPTEATKTSSPRSAGVDPSEPLLPKHQKHTMEGSRKSKMESRTDPAGTFMDVELPTSEGTLKKKCSKMNWLMCFGGVRSKRKNKT